MATGHWVWIADDGEFEQSDDLAEQATGAGVCPQCGQETPLEVTFTEKPQPHATVKPKHPPTPPEEKIVVETPPKLKDKDSPPDTAQP